VEKLARLAVLLVQRSASNAAAGNARAGIPSHRLRTSGETEKQATRCRALQVTPEDPRSRLRAILDISAHVDLRLGAGDNSGSAAATSGASDAVPLEALLREGLQAASLAILQVAAEDATACAAAAGTAALSSNAAAPVSAARPSSAAETLRQREEPHANTANCAAR